MSAHAESAPATEEPLRSPRRRRRRTPTLVFAGVAAVAVGAATAAAVGFGGGEQGTADAASLPPETATVDRETLRDVRLEAGTLGYGSETALRNRLTGTITALVETGTTVGRGDILYEVDEAPVVLLYGSIPAYRDLAPGAEGSDVEQLEKNLEKLDYTGFTVDDEYTDATAAAVEQWQADLGLPETGVVQQGRVVFVPGSLRISAADASIGDVVQPGEAVLSGTGTDQVVTVEMDVDDQPLAEPGTAVTVTLPDGSSLAGEVADLESVVQTSDEQVPPGEEAEQETVLEVTVALDDPDAVEGYDQASVDVGFVAGEREDVLTVPVAALLALREGGYGVEVIEGGTTLIVAVDTGLFAGGRVEVTGEGLTEGMTVGMPS